MGSPMGPGAEVLRGESFCFADTQQHVEGLLASAGRQWHTHLDKELHAGCLVFAVGSQEKPHLAGHGHREMWQALAFRD